MVSIRIDAGKPQDKSLFEAGSETIAEWAMKIMP